ncbi:hypothetical protein [Spongiactinospora sp. TRM90649]|uniref:hypothetical protein n=1 Tax=Spongiactinospora sp. TRM90649 TaxID=3031114 RepID=UPI0023F7E433|nr:hypothetical protein [Spongiactinospora sp. TRM90649]MDF5756221.1 hypothetical protein [Spongiactinospora sp. TRM90649]
MRARRVGHTVWSEQVPGAQGRGRDHEAEAGERQTIDASGGLFLRPRAVAATAGAG